MQYTGANCPVCGQSFKDGDDIVVCPVCGTPHHRDCFNGLGGCKNAERHKDGYVWRAGSANMMSPAAPTGMANVKICPRCGMRNDPFEPVCVNCGERLKSNRETIEDQIPNYNNEPFGGYGERPNPNNFSPYQNVYAADTRILYGPEAAIDGVPATEVAEYVQKNSNKYVGDFLDMQKRGTKLKWNWSAAVFNIFWVFYRRMIGLGFSIMIILFAVNVSSSLIVPAVYEHARPEIYNEYNDSANEFFDALNGALEEGGEIPAESYESFARDILLSPITLTHYIVVMGAYLVSMVVIGFFGNNFYKNHIVKDIKKVRNIAINAESYHMFLATRGGVSYINVLLPILFGTLINMFSIM